MKKTIRGKIIRILDTSTVVINLGKNHGIQESTIFSILGQPETLVDPFSNEELGNVSIVKGRVKASTVSEKFTIATSKWTSYSYQLSKSILGLSTINFPQEIDKVEKDLRVKQDEVKPWKAESEDFVQVGDDVEVTVDVVDEKEKSKSTQKK